MRKLNISDISTIKKFAKLANYNEYNSNVVTMIMWNHLHEIFIEEHEHYVLVLVNYHHHFAWLMPLCEVSYRKEALLKMKEISQERHISFEIHAMTLEFKTYCETHDFPFVYHYNRDAEDYVYDIQQQQSLVGKKMQKRRNHYNAFLKEYEHRFTYQPLTPFHESEVMHFLSVWKVDHIHPEEIDTEILGIQTLFQYFDLLELKGGCLYIDGKLEAFSIYSELADDTIQMHVEKANRTIRGLYIAILKHTLAHADTKYRYLNREDDLGEPELRKAKTDMKPIYRIQRFTAYYGKTEIIQPKAEDVFQIKKLWLESFPEENQRTTDFYFHSLFHLEDTYCLVHDRLILCMLQVRKIPIMKDHQKQTAHFIVGVATHPYYQKCGYMKQLLNSVLSLYQHEMLFIQAYNWDLYRPFGFHEAYLLKKTLLHPKGKNQRVEPCSDAAHLLDLYTQYCHDKDGYRIRDLAYYANYFIPYMNLDGFIYANDQAYIVGIENEEEVIIQEAIYLSQEALLQLIQMFNKKVVLYSDCSLQLDETSEIVNAMMVKDPFNLNDQLFIREFL